MTKRRSLLTAALTVTLLAGCDGPHEKAGEKVDAATGAPRDAFGRGPQERLGELQDRQEHDRGRAIEARADVEEDRADELRSAADERAAALERQAAAIRGDAKQSARALDRHADALRGK